MPRACVIGWPVEHSRSPLIHRYWLKQYGIDGAYEKEAVRPEALTRFLGSLGAQGFAGANVTLPHKEAALRLAAVADEAARAIGAANTLSFGADGAIAADNTDAPGLLAALGDRRPSSALILGAGGSARAAAYALAHAGAAVAVWNRTPERARALADELGVEAVDAPVAAEVLVNCTSVGLTDPSSTFKELPVKADSVGEYACVVDLVYRTGGTVLAQEARRRGSRVIDGLEILVQQGALSFEGWTGRAAPVQVMREAARA
jgi:shikimate dehydrogenase